MDRSEDSCCLALCLGQVGRLRAGVPATLEVTEEAVHAFAATAPDTPEARSAIERLGRILGAHFAGGASAPA